VTDAHVRGVLPLEERGERHPAARRARRGPRRAGRVALAFLSAAAFVVALNWYGLAWLARVGGFLAAAVVLLV